MKLSYMGGDIVTKTLNDAFGYDGWCLEVKNTAREETIKDDKGRYHVAYIATVRITHRKSGVYREDCGAGDAIDRSLASASGNALKGAVTDAMKRAAKHFGEKLGNALYHDGFNANNAPPTLKDALNTLDIERAKSRFGFDKDRKMNTAAAGNGNNTGSIGQQQQQQQSLSNQSSSTTIKQEHQKRVQMNNNVNTNSTKQSIYQQTPRTQYVGNVVMEHSNMTKVNSHDQAKSSQHVTPHHNGAGNNTTKALANQSNTAAKPMNTYVTPGNRSTTQATATTASTTAKKSSASFDPTKFAAIPAEKLLGKNNNTIMKENCNPKSYQQNDTGLALPPRPGTSRGINASDNSPTSAYIANFSNVSSTTTPSMFGVNGTMSQALTMEQQSQPSSIAQSLKRKSEDESSSVAAKLANTKNPYSQC